MMSSDGIDSKQLLTSDGKTMESEDASKVVKTVKSFRELKALYEAKSTAPADPVPAKPGSIAKRFPAAVSSSNSPALPANRLTSSGSSPTKPAWKKNDPRSGSVSLSTLSPVAEDSSTSTGAPVGGSALTRSDQSPEPAPLGSVARRSEAAKVAASPSSPRTWGRQSSGKVATTANATGANSAVSSASDSFATVASDGASHDAPSTTDSATGAGTWHKRLNVEKAQAERDANHITPDSGRGRTPSITIEKGKVASVKEKFLGADATAGANKFKSLGTTDQPSHISERGRAISGELRDGRGMESPRVSELIRGLTRSQEQEQNCAYGGPFRGGSGTMAKSHNGIKEHNRSHSDTTGDLSVLPTKNSSTSPDAVSSVDGQGRPKPATNGDEGPLPTWALRWQQRLQEKEKERERDKERLAEAIRSRSGTEDKDKQLETSAEQARAEAESIKADTKQTNESDAKHEQEPQTTKVNHVAQEVAQKSEGSQSADRAKPADISKDNEQTPLVESPASVPPSEEESSSGRTAGKSTSDAPKRTSGVYDQQVLELIGEEEVTRAMSSPPASPLIRTRKPDPRRLSRTERLSSSPDKERRGSVIERSVTRSSSVDESDPLSQRNHGSAIGISTRRSTIGSSTPPSTGTLRRHSKDSASSSANNSSPSSSPKPSRDDKADTPKRRAETTSSSSAKRRDGEASSERDRSERDKDRDKEIDREKREKERDKDRDRGDKDREREKDRQRERDRDREKDREKESKERDRDRSDKDREKEPKERERDKEKDRAKDRPKRDESSVSREDKSATTAAEKKDTKNESRSSTIERRSRTRKDEPSSSSSASSQSAFDSSKRKDRSGTLSQLDAKRSEAGSQETSNPASSPQRERRKESRADKTSGSDSPRPARNPLPPDSPHSSSRTEASPRSDSVLASPKRTEESRSTEEKKNKSVKPLTISNDGSKSGGSSPTVGSRTPRLNTPRARSERSKDSEESDRDKEKDRKDEKKEREREKDRSERDKEKGKDREREKEREKERKYRDEKGPKDKERNRDREKDDKEKQRNEDKDRTKDKDRRDRKDKERKSKDPYSSGEIDIRVERKEREPRENSERSRDKEKRDGRIRERGKDKERQEERDNDTKKEEQVVAEKEEEGVEAEGELKNGEATGEIAAVIEASDSDSDDTSIRGEIVDVSDDEGSSRSDIDDIKRAGITLTIDSPPEPVTTVKDEADMKQCFVDFMNQYYENKSSTENKPKSTLTSKPKNRGSEVRRRSRTATKEKIVLEAFPRYNHRDSLGTRSEIEDSLTETDVTAMSEFESETEYGTETEGEIELDSDVDEVKERSKKNRSARADTDELEMSDFNEEKAESDQGSAIGEHGKDSESTTTIPKLSVTQPATISAGSSLKYGKKDDFSSSPAAALFGSPKKKDRSRYSVLFGSKSDDRKSKSAQSQRRSMYTAFLSRTTSHGGADGKKTLQPRSGLSTQSSTSPSPASSLSSSPPQSAPKHHTGVHLPIKSLVAEHSSSFHASTDCVIPPRAVGSRLSVTSQSSQDGPEADSSGGSSIIVGSDVSGDEAAIPNEQEIEKESSSSDLKSENESEESSAKSAVSKIEEKAKVKRLNFDEAVQLFNESKPTRAVRLLITNGFLREDAEDIARFLHSANHSLDKEKLGILLSENEDIFPDVLKAFIDQMDFHMYDFDVALRKLLFTFRLPGEAQKIDRIVKVWANHWWEQNPGLLPLMKCAYVLAYAVIMLNTDAHNEMVRYKMTLKEFLVNVANNDGGELIPQAFLEDIYPRIVEEEIKMEDEGALFPTACKKGWLQVRSKKAFHTWKRRWVVLTTDRLHILRKIGDKHPLQSIPLDNLLMNTPIKEQSKKFLLFLYHAPDSSHREDRTSGHASAGTLKERRLKSVQHGTVGSSNESAPRRGQRGELLDLNDRVVTVLCTFEKEVFDAWVASITRNIGIKSRLKKVSSTKF